MSTHTDPNRDFPDSVASFIDRTVAAVASDSRWVIRCARRMAELHPGLQFTDALYVAQAMCYDDGLRARLPEEVADDMLGNRRYFS